MRFTLALLAALAAAPAVAEPPQVVADIAPVHALLSQVMEGVATPLLLLGQGDNPHSAQLRPSQARMLARADLVVWVGPELSPWLEDIVAREAGDHIALTAHPATRLRTVPQAGETADGQERNGGARGEEADGDGAHDEAAHGKHADGEEAVAGHAHSGVDPHVWLSTRNARAWIAVFADTLAARDPANAAAYRANAAGATAGIDALDARIEHRLAAQRGAEIVTFHDSFRYFAQDFGIAIAGSVRAGDASAPSAAALSRLRGIVAGNGIECAFAEPAFDPGLIDAIAGDTGLRIGVLDPTGALLPAGPDHYTATLAGIAGAIADCLERD